MRVAASPGFAPAYARSYGGQARSSGFREPPKEAEGRSFIRCAWHAKLLMNFSIRVPPPKWRVGTVLPRHDFFTLTLHKIRMPPQPWSSPHALHQPCLHRRGERAGRGASVIANENSSWDRKASGMQLLKVDCACIARVLCNHGVYTRNPQAAARRRSDLGILIRLTKVDFPHIPQDRRCDHLPSEAGASISCRNRSSFPCSCFQWAMGPMETERLGRENAATSDTNALDEWH